MIEENQIKFIELLCSKLCHDLISPIGAISNGLEFLEQEDNDLNEEAMKLVKKSSRQAAKKLAYYRIALGTAGSEDFIQCNTVVDLIEKFSVEKNLVINWSGLEDNAQSKFKKSSGKLLLNLALISFDSLPRGGLVKITLSKNSETPDMIISFSGENCNLHKDVRTVLENDISEDLLTVRNILAFYCKQLALRCSKKIEIQEVFKNRVVLKVV